jgi:hypothetical protein
VVNALFSFGTTGIGFGGVPWTAFAIGASLILLRGIEQLRELFICYSAQPKTDVVLVKIFEIGLAVVGALASAWAGYRLRLLMP